MVQAATRFTTKCSRTTCEAPASAASTAAASPCSANTGSLSGQSSQIAGASGPLASAVVTCAGNGAYSTSICSAASLAWLTLSATTIATD